MGVTRRFILMAVAVAAASCTSDRPASTKTSQATSSEPSPLVGTWTLRAVEMTDSAGRSIEAPHAVGIIIYTPEGRMATESMVLPRPIVPPVPPGPGEVSAWSGEQARKVVETYDAYFGRYEVDQATHIVTHHVEGELRPDHVGSTYMRRYEVDGDRLVLSPTNPDEHWRVVWERVR